MELRASGLPWAIYEFIKEMVDSTRVNALLSEADTVMRQLRKMGNVYECVLLRYDLPSFDSVPVDENSLRQSESKPNMMLQKKYIMKRVE